MLLALALVGYLLGSIPFGLLVTRAAGLGDIRAIGSGNIGATNVLRTGRRGLAATTLLLDGGKGALAVGIGGIVAGPLGMAVAGLGAFLGHLFPLWLKFRGGKGVATGLGILLALEPLAGIAACAVWLAAAAVTQMSSAGALCAFAAAPLLMWGSGASAWPTRLSAVIALLVWLRHRANLSRMLAGTEPRIGGK